MLYVMKRNVALTALCFLSACGNPEVNGCEQFVKEGLRSPSTYNRIGVTSSERPAKSSDFSIGGTETQKIAAKEEAQLGLKVRVITIKYEAANAYGTPVRGEQSCGFKVVGRDGPSRDEISSNVDMATSDRTFEAFLKQNGQTHTASYKSALYPCCLGLRDRTEPTK